MNLVEASLFTVSAAYRRRPIVLSAQFFGESAAQFRSMLVSAWVQSQCVHTATSGCDTAMIGGVLGMRLRCRGGRNSILWSCFGCPSMTREENMLPGVTNRQLVGAALKHQLNDMSQDRLQTCDRSPRRRRDVRIKMRLTSATADASGLQPRNRRTETKGWKLSDSVVMVGAASVRFGAVLRLAPVWSTLGRGAVSRAVPGFSGGTNEFALPRCNVPTPRRQG